MYDLKKRFNYSKFIIEILKYLWLVFNCLLAIPYIIALIEKIRRPEFKNLSTNEFISFGIFLLISIILNLLWLYKLKKAHFN
jgi:small neutral amino acid transporter SnatA (MarC family)